MSKAQLLSLFFLLCFLFIIQAEFEKEQCILQDKFKQLVASQKSNHECPPELLSSFPEPDEFAFILDQRSLHNQRIVRRVKKKEGKPAANTCYQKEGAVQFNVATYNDRDTVIIYFYGTEGDWDVSTDMFVTLFPDYLPDILSSDIKKKHPKKYEDPKSEISQIRVHLGIARRLRHDYFTRTLREKLLGIYYDNDDFSKIKKPTKLVLGGRSLGAAYAILFYLNLIGDRYTSKLTGLSILPKELASITVIPIGSPMVIYHRDIHKISKDVQDRIFNIITYRDPVVLMSSGKKSEEQLSGIGASGRLEFVSQFATDDKLVRLGTNGPVGKFIMFMQSKHVSKIEKWAKNRFGNGKNENIVVKVLDPKEDYLNYGAECLWTNTKGGVLGLHLWPLYHRKKPYLEHIMNSCIYLHLEKSEYWKKVQKKYSNAVNKKKIKKHVVWRGSKKDNKPIYYNWEIIEWWK